MAVASTADTTAIIELNRASQIPTLTEIRDCFDLLDDWEDRYRYVIELGSHLAKFAALQRTDEYLVRGCQSQVWLRTGFNPVTGKMHLAIDSDAHIVRGLAAILIAALSGKQPQDILAADTEALFVELDLVSHLSPSRGNGLRAMIARIRQYAQAICTDQASTE